MTNVEQQYKISSRLVAVFLLLLLMLSLLIAVQCVQLLRLMREVNMMDELQRHREENAALRQRMEQWLDEWDVMAAEVTAYAPLDPAAVPGMCYAGYPEITASGNSVTPGLTVAAGRDVPFGSRVWVAGAMRTVQDRGGRIGPGSLDICVATRTEALRFGRQRTVVVVERKGSD